MSGELFGVKGRKLKQIELERKIRPYRHLICSFKQEEGVGYENAEFNVLINEFGDNIITYDVGASIDGRYYFNINPAFFKNTNNVVLSVNFSYTTLEKIPYISINFSNNAYTTIIISSIDIDTATNINITGKIFIKIIEYYE